VRVMPVGALQRSHGPQRPECEDGARHFNDNDIGDTPFFDPVTAQRMRPMRRTPRPNPAPAAPIEANVSGRANPDRRAERTQSIPLEILGTYRIGPGGGFRNEPSHESQTPGIPGSTSLMIVIRGRSRITTPIEANRRASRCRHCQNLRSRRLSGTRDRPEAQVSHAEQSQSVAPNEPNGNEPRPLAQHPRIGHNRSPGYRCGEGASDRHHRQNPELMAGNF
jgi:hypothetical protein